MVDAKAESNGSTSNGSKEKVNGSKKGGDGETKWAVDPVMGFNSYRWAGYNLEYFYIILYKILIFNLDGHMYLWMLKVYACGCHSVELTRCSSTLSLNPPSNPPFL